MATDEEPVMSKPALVQIIPRLMTIQQVAQRFGVGKGTIWRWESEGRIPRAIRVTRRTVRWREADIDAHVAALKP
jgi:prophage regulatory protein